MKKRPSPADSRRVKQTSSPARPRPLSDEELERVTGGAAPNSDQIDPFALPDR
jgi:hypothetical protein